MSLRTPCIFLITALVFALVRPVQGDPLPGDSRTTTARASLRTDALGDPLPPGALARFGTLRWRHILRDGNGFATVSLSPDGQMAASVGDVGLRLWETGTGKPLTWLPPDPLVKAALFAPDGKTLLSAREQRRQVTGGREQVCWTIQHCEVGTGKVRHQVEVHSFHELVTGFPQFSRDGKFFMSTENTERDKNVSLWDTATGKRYARIDQETTFWNPLAVSPDGKTLAVSGRDEFLHLYDLPSGRPLYKLPPPDKIPYHGYYAPAFTPDSRTLIASGPRSLFFWDVTSGKPRHEVKECRGPVAFTADGKHLACGAESAIRLFDLASLKEIRRFDPYEGEALSLVFSADGKRLLSGHGYALGLWDVGTGRRLNSPLGHDLPVVSLAFAPDGKSLASGAESDRRALLWDLETGRPRQRLPGHFFSATTMAFAPDGKMLATGDGYTRFSTAHNEATIRLWNPTDGSLLRQFPAHLGGFSSLSFSADGQTLVSAGYEAQVRLWEVKTGRRVGQVRSPYSFVQAADLTPDGKTLLIRGTKSHVGLWRSDTAKKLRDLGSVDHSRRQICSTFFLRDGRTLLCWEEILSFPRDVPAEFVFRDIGTDKVLRAIPAPPDPINEVCQALSPDGFLLATATGNPESRGVIQLWDLETGTPMTSLSGHNETVSALAFSPDGKILASGSRDTTILLWDLAWPRLEELWAQMGKGKRLPTDPARAVPFLKERLQQMAATEKRFQTLLTDLDDDSFEVRERASTELSKLGPVVLPALHMALAASPSAEVRRRIEWVLDSLSQNNPGGVDESKRLQCAVKTLEIMGTTEARQALGELAHGEAALFVTRLAREALDRLEKSGHAPDPGPLRQMPGRHRPG